MRKIGAGDARTPLHAIPIDGRVVFGSYPTQCDLSPWDRRCSQALRRRRRTRVGARVEQRPHFGRRERPGVDPHFVDDTFELEFAWIAWSPSDVHIEKRIDLLVADSARQFTIVKFAIQIDIHGLGQCVVHPHHVIPPAHQKFRHAKPNHVTTRGVRQLEADRSPACIWSRIQLKAILVPLRDDHWSRRA